MKMGNKLIKRLLKGNEEIHEICMRAKMIKKQISDCDDVCK